MRVVIAEDQALLREGLARLFRDGGHDVVGTLPDGFVFDTSYKDKGEPLEFRYDPAHPAVIQGWILGLKGMRVGGRRKLTITAPLAYGASPPPGSPIPPNAALIYDVQLVYVGDEA